MKKLLFVPLLIASLLAAIPAFASEGIAVIDMRNAVLATQVAQDAFKALEEETEYAANIERAETLPLGTPKAPNQELEIAYTPGVKTIDDVCNLLKISSQKTIKTLPSARI